MSTAWAIFSAKNSLSDMKFAKEKVNIETYPVAFTLPAVDPSLTPPPATYFILFLYAYIKIKSALRPSKFWTKKIRGGPNF